MLDFAPLLLVSGTAALYAPSPVNAAAGGNSDDAADVVGIRDSARPRAERLTRARHRTSICPSVREPGVAVLDNSEEMRDPYLLTPASRIRCRQTRNLTSPTCASGVVSTPRARRHLLSKPPTRAS